jgi:hypothetical protein
MQDSTGISRRTRSTVRAILIVASVVASGAAARAIFGNLTLVRTLHEGVAEHLEQDELVALVRDNRLEEAFEAAFEHGDELFETTFNAIDGVGANVGGGQRFTRVPRADRTGPGEWATHVPSRATGPNAQACNTCHNQPTDDGAGGASSDVVRDPAHSGALRQFISRNTPHLFGAGAVQRLAEEMSERLGAQQSAAIAAICAAPLGAIQTKTLSAKGVSFGSIRVARVSRGGAPCPGAPARRFTLDTSGVRGVDADLVVKPFQWKGSVAFLRDFNRDAAHNELGMQAMELVGDGVDGDSDGVADELTIGDQTALAVYLGAQPRPVTVTELGALGLAPAQSAAELAAIANGAVQFRRAGCDGCHKPVLTLDDAVFSEPSQAAAYRDNVFPGGQSPGQHGVDPGMPVTYDLTQRASRTAFMSLAGQDQAALLAFLNNLVLFKQEE